MSKAAFVYADQLSRHVLRPGHPMQPARLRYTYQLLDAFHAFDGPDSRLVEPRPATEQELMTFHTSEYVSAVRNLSHGISLPSPERYGFGQAGDNPVYPGMYEASLLSTGASLAATDLLLSGEAQVVFSPSGGLHHAMPASASGFCVFNDPVIAINAMVARGLRVAYVDIDAHHGDGVQHAFYDTDAVLTVSLHESGRYLFPGTGSVAEAGAGPGTGYSVNVPLAPFTDDEVYLWAFQQVVPPLLSAFQPDLLVAQLGIDTYYLDPITHLALTSRGYTRAVQALAEVGRSVPWLALGGGGYDLSAVARCWTLAYGVMSNQEWPDAVPPHLQGTVGKAALRDTEQPEIPSETLEEAQRFAEASVQEIRERIFPHHGL